MRLLFIDPTRMQYTTDTPYERPLGGSQSALCYLSEELVRRGHSVTVLNGATSETESNGVRIANMSALSLPGFSAHFDVGIVLNAAIAHELRRDQGLTIPLIL